MVSVIVPIYKVEKYIGPCVESILNSTYRDIELILVDDGSPDSSGDICDRYAQQDDRVRVIHKENGGVSSARNEGIKAAKGDYIMFVDGDDRIHCQMVEVLILAIGSGNFDFSMAYVARVEDDTFILYDDSIIYEKIKGKIETQTISRKEYFMGLCTLDFLKGYHIACSKLYKKHFIKDMQFEQIISEDLEWSNRICLRMNQAILVKSKLYFYLQRKGSSMHSGGKNLIDRIQTYKLCLDTIPQDNHEYRDRMLKLLYSMMLFIRRKCANSIYEKEAELVCAEVYERTIQEFRQSNNGWLSKQRSIIGYHCPRLYNFATKIIERIIVTLYKIAGRQ